jgi:DNA-binding NtrC family response regulator
VTARIAPRGRLLLVEPQFVLRRTVATMAREMGLADVQEATSPAVAERLLSERRFSALLVAIDEDGEALQLLQRLRAGETHHPADVPLAVTAAACDVELAMRLKQLDVVRLLLKPFKVRGMLEVISALGAPEPLPGA